MNDRVVTYVRECNSEWAPTSPEVEVPGHHSEAVKTLAAQLAAEHGATSDRSLFFLARMPGGKPLRFEVCLEAVTRVRYAAYCQGYDGEDAPV